MDSAITMEMIMDFAKFVVAIAGFITAALVLLRTVTDRHDREQKWDQCEKDIKQVKEEQCMLTYCMMATLDGLHQLGCNGKVTEARSQLDKFMNKQAHGVE